MKKRTILSKEEATSIALASQGLAGDKNFGKGKTATFNAILHLGYVQLDTLSVVARAHHHIIHTRTRSHEENFLNDLMREKRIFEYWSHAAAYLPMEDFRFSLIRKNDFIKGKAHWFEKDKKMHKYVLDKIKAEGALQAKDFETDKTRGSWFDWKPAKIALEQLFQNGKLMVVERKGFQKVYDLSERILPAGINTTLHTQDEFAGYLIRSTLRAHGIASHKDMTHLRTGMKVPVEKMLKKFLNEGEISEARIDSVNEIYYRFADNELSFSSRQSAIHKSTIILSPFDNAIIRRERLLKLFDYDYQLECYLPESKRKFGYFCLPILYGNEFIGKFDPKADRATGIFHVKRLYLENPPKDMDEFLHSFAITLKAFAKFNGCEKIVVEKTFPAKLKTEMKKFLNRES